VKSVSVEYTWRDERKTEAGTEFLGLIFDKVDLLENAKAGDPNTELHLVESNIRLLEGELAVAECKDCKSAGECEKCKEYTPELVECPKCHERFEFKQLDKTVEYNEVTKLTEEKVLVESVDSKKSEPKKEEVKGKEAMPPVVPEPIVPLLPTIPEPSSIPPITIAAAANITPASNVTVVPPTIMTPETQKLIESQANTIAQQDIALVKLQEAVKTKEAEKIKAVNDAVKDVRKDIITKVESVLPDPTIISRFNKGGQRLAEEIRKVVYEENKKD
jgi:Zn ribbon nucleic-acid-binding protein/soluble cytochrome b562